METDWIVDGSKDSSQVLKVLVDCLIYDFFIGKAQHIAHEYVIESATWDEIFERVKQRARYHVPVVHFSASFQAVSLLLLVPELLLLPPQLLALSGHALGLLAALLRDKTATQ